MIDKTIRCRYFDEQGRATRPVCGRGTEHCRFVHPEEQGWKTAIPTRHRAQTRSPSRAPQLDAHSPPHYPRQAQPIPSNSSRDFEERRWEEAASSRSVPHTDQGHYPDRSQIREPPSRPRASSPTRGMLPPTEPASRRDFGKQLVDSPLVSPTHVHPPTSHESLPIVKSSSQRNGSADDKQRVQDLVGLFRQLASVMNEATLDAAATDAEAQKVQSFTTLSNSLSQISPPATAAVAPSLVNAVASHKRAQDRTNAGFARLGQLWGEILSVAAQGLAAELDAGVNDALARMRTDAREAVDRMVVDALRREGIKQEHVEGHDVSAGAKRKSPLPESQRDYPTEEEGRAKRARGNSRNMEVDQERAPAPAPPAADATTAEMLRMMNAMMAQLSQQNTTTTSAQLPPPLPPPPRAPIAHAPDSPRNRPRSMRQRSPPPQAPHPPPPHEYSRAPPYERPSRRASGNYEYDQTHDIYSHSGPPPRGPSGQSGYHYDYGPASYDSRR